jgi:hypothetical protein
MAPVAGIDHVDLRCNMSRDEVRRPALRVAHHEHVGVHRAQVVYGIQQGLALAGGRRTDIQIDHVRRQAFRGDLEGGAGAGAVLEEHVEHRFPVQQRHFLDFESVVGIDEGRGSVEDIAQDAHRQTLSRQQVLQFAVFI